MPTISGPSPSFATRHKFYLEIDGVAEGKFMNCSELTSTFDVIEHRQGGTSTAYKAPGLLNFEDVTLERGVKAGDFDLHAWHLQCGDASISGPQGPGIGQGVGLPGNLYKRNVEIVQLDRDATELFRWRLNNAWPSSYTAGAWDNDTSETLIESITLTIESFELV